jgi:hypothetical protein
MILPIHITHLNQHVEANEDWDHRLWKCCQGLSPPIYHAFYQRAPVPENGKPHVSIDYPDAKHYADLDEFLKDSEIELVCVLTQYDTHAAFAEKALLAGKHGKSCETLT